MRESEIRFSYSPSIENLFTGLEEVEISGSPKVRVDAPGTRHNFAIKKTRVQCASEGWDVTRGGKGRGGGS